MPESQHILIIDDDVQLVDTVETLLKSVGYKVSYAYQPARGIELARDSQPDLILLDVMFAGPPGPDGVEVSRQLHQDPDLQEIPVIILSGVKKVLDMPVKLGPDETYMPVQAFLEKPFKPDQLLAAIEKVLGPRS
jgi:CheY-like chemotaxis protein